MCMCPIYITVRDFSAWSCVRCRATHHIGSLNYTVSITTTPTLNVVTGVHGCATHRFKHTSNLNPCMDHEHASSWRCQGCSKEYITELSLSSACMQIQDTPGYGDDLNLELNIGRVKQYIIDQNQAWLRLENSAGRGELNAKVDPRVDICLFCLPPHRVRNIDMLFMWEISQVCAGSSTLLCTGATVCVVLWCSCLALLYRI